MRVMHQVLAPGVQHRQDAQLMRAQVAGVGGDLAERLMGRFEQQAVEQALVLQRQGSDLAGQREDQMEVGDRQQFGGPLLQPLGAGQRLALGAMPIAARVIGDRAVVAAVAGRDVTAQGGGAAALDGPRDAPLLAR